MVWPVGSGYREEFAPSMPKGTSPTSSPPFQFLRLAGPFFLFWYPGLAGPTLDLNPGKGFVESGGTTTVAAGSNRRLVAIGLVGSPPAAGSRAFGQRSILTLHPATAPAIDAGA